MSSITLYKSLVDWVTLTGKSHAEIVEYWGEFQATRNDYRGSLPYKWLQYKGEMRSYDEGNIFTGIADISREDMVCIRASGEVAHDVAMFFFPLVQRGILKPTRIDVQITVQEPEDWSQIRFLNRVHTRGKKAELATSQDDSTGKILQTVAVGSRTSETYYRVYQKLTDGGERLLRFEVEYKQKKAVAVYESLLQATPAQNLKHSIDKLKDDKLTAVFASPLEGVKPHNARPRVTARDKKAMWLLEKVLPSFEEYINEHADSGEVVGAFLAVLEDYLQL